MVTENLAKLSEKEKLLMVRKALPYQYASIIAKRLADKNITATEVVEKNITAQQVRLVFYEQITDPTIALPVLVAAWALYEERKRANTLIDQAQKELAIKDELEHV